jgi:MFS family permease
MLVLAGGVTTTFIALTPGPIWLLMVAAMAAGAVRGNLTLLQATAVTDRWGATHYARLTAVLTAPVTIAGALAPWAGSALANQLGSYRSLFLALAGVSILATVFTHASRGTERNQRGEAQAAGIKIRHDPSHPRSKSRTDVVEERPSGTVAT